MVGDLALGGVDRLLQIDHADRLVGEGAEVPAEILEVGDAGPFGDLVDRLADRPSSPPSPSGMSNWLRIWKAASTASSAVSFGAADWL